MGNCVVVFIIVSGSNLLSLTLVRIREMPGDVELPACPQRGLRLPPRHPARGAGADRVEEVQGEVPPLGEVEADVSVGGLGEEQDQEEGRCPEEEDRHRVGPSLPPRIFLLLDEVFKIMFFLIFK